MTEGGHELYVLRLSQEGLCSTLEPPSPCRSTTLEYRASCAVYGSSSWWIIHSEPAACVLLFLFISLHVSCRRGACSFMQYTDSSYGIVNHLTYAASLLGFCKVLVRPALVERQQGGDRKRKLLCIIQSQQLCVSKIPWQPHAATYSGCVPMFLALRASHGRLSHANRKSLFSVFPQGPRLTGRKRVREREEISPPPSSANKQQRRKCRCSGGNSVVARESDFLCALEKTLAALGEQSPPEGYLYVVDGQFCVAQAAR